MELLLFDDAEEPHPTRAIDLEARKHRTYHYWHVFVPGIRAGQLYGYREREPGQSINFVTCHDGFTLNDLVSYNDKHNEAEWRRKPGRAE